MINAEMWKRAVPVLALYIMASCAFAQDHRSVLDQRKQGEIAPFDTMLHVARLAVGENAVLLDAQLLNHRSGDRVRIFFRKPDSRQVVTVTLDASSGDLIAISNRRRLFLWERLFSGGFQANSRRNAQSQSGDQPSETTTSAGTGKGSGKGKDVGRGSGGGKNSNGKDSSGKSGRSDSGGKGKGGSKR
ncbi:MAG: hypothetical protein AAF724_15915 [Pseudomonadota bacterium]